MGKIYRWKDIRKMFHSKLISIEFVFNHVLYFYFISILCYIQFHSTWIMKWWNMIGYQSWFILRNHFKRADKICDFWKMRRTVFLFIQTFRNFLTKCCNFRYLEWLINSNKFSSSWRENLIKCTRFNIRRNLQEFKGI